MNHQPYRKAFAMSLFRQNQFVQAERLYQELCLADPLDTESQFMLAVVKYMSGKLEDAAQLFRQALQQQPDSPRLLIGLGNTLLKKGGLSEAEGFFQRALETLPNSSEALFGLAQISYLRRSFDLAAGLCSQALAISPNLAEAWYLQGQAQRSMGGHESAISSLQRAIAISPGHMPAHVSLASALVETGRTEEAEQVLAHASKINPEDPLIVYSEAELLEHKGDYHLAWNRLAPFIRAGTMHYRIAIVYANICLHLNKCEEAIDYAERLLGIDGSDSFEKEELHFALGRLYDRLGEYDRAFELYASANRMRPDVFDADREAVRVEALVQAFSREFLDNAPHAACSSRKPVFIVGMPRSGTSLVEQILASHPDVYGAGELGHISRMVTKLTSMIDPASAFPANIVAARADMLTQLAQQYLDELHQLSPDAARVTDKMPHNFQLLGLIELLFPDARVIHCVRDPRDTSLSNYFQHFSTAVSYASRLENIGFFYHQYRKLMQHYESVLHLPVLNVRYEDLVENQDEMSRRLVEFIGLEWDEACLDFHKTGRYVATSSYEQVRRAMYSASIGRWKHYEKHLGPLLAVLEED